MYYITHAVNEFCEGHININKVKGEERVDLDLLKPQIFCKLSINHTMYVRVFFSFYNLY